MRNRKEYTYILNPQICSDLLAHSTPIMNIRNVAMDPFGIDSRSFPRIDGIRRTFFLLPVR